jgi:hypothetical protein
MSVHDRYDQDTVSFYGVQHRIGKSPCETAPNIVVQDSSGERRFQDPSDGIFDGLNKSYSQRFIALGIVQSRFLIVFQRFRMDLPPHRRKESRTFLSASSPGIDWTDRSGHRLVCASPRPARAGQMVRALQRPGSP